MPLINGQKMACEPCIRGHRSTKCTHANERLMVPVRKPGRPLSSCPHPSSKSCSCGAVTAAIPRKQKCSCGSSDKAMVTKTEPEDSNPVATPPSDIKASSSSFRVQKTTSRRGSAMKPSIDPAGLERMDSSQLNIVSNHDTAQTPIEMASTHMPSIEEMHSYGAAGMTTAENSFSSHSMMFPMFSQPMQSSMLHAGSSNPSTNGHTSPKPNGVSVPARGGCCGGGANGDKSQDSSTSRGPSTPVSNGNNYSTKQTGSCCSSNTVDSDNRSAPNATNQPQGPHPFHGMMMPPFQGPMPMVNGMYPFFPQPTVFTYPPQYGTYMQPLQPEQWRQVMAALSFGHPPQSNAFNNMTGAGVGTAPYTPPPQDSPKNTGTSHQCDCGEGCQCVGCAAHPYNEATQNYVRSAWNSMMEEYPNGNGNYSSNGTSQDVSANHTPSETRAASTTPADVSGNGTTPKTPSDAASVLTEEQTLSANDFFFVSYPFGDPCAGDTASCPCGDDCQCIGCVIHSNPDPSQPSQASEQ